MRQTLYVVCGLLLGENNDSNQLLGAFFNKVLVSMLSQTCHKVENCLAAQNLMAHIKAQHDAGLVLQDVRDKARPDGQPAMKNTGQRQLLTLMSWYRFYTLLAQCVKPAGVELLYTDTPPNTCAEGCSGGPRGCSNDDRSAAC